MKSCPESVRIAGAALAAIILALSQGGAPQTAQAEDAGVICAAVMPCNQEDGSVFAPFNSEGPCKSYYENICEQNHITLLNAKVAELESRYNICVESLTALAGNSKNPSSVIINPGEKKKKKNKEKKKVIQTDF